MFWSAGTCPRFPQGRHVSLPPSVVVPPQSKAGTPSHRDGLQQAIHWDGRFATTSAGLRATILPGEAVADGKSSRGVAGLVAFDCRGDRVLNHNLKSLV